MPAKNSLLQLQRRFMAALVEPIYGDSRNPTYLPPRTGHVSVAFLTTANDYISPSPTLNPTERLELYHRQYWYRLLDSIAEDFPALRTFLGETVFWGFIERYLEAHPPRDINLRHLGATLANFIATEQTSLSHGIHAEELARLEYAICEIVEEPHYPPIVAADLAHVAIALQPHVRLLAMRTAAHSFWRSRRKRSFKTVHSSPRFFLVVYRQGHRIHVESISRSAHQLLSAFATHTSLDTVMGMIANLPRHLQPPTPQAVANWFRLWFERGWFRKADCLGIHHG